MRASQNVHYERCSQGFDGYLGWAPLCNPEAFTRSLHDDLGVEEVYSG